MHTFRVCAIGFVASLAVAACGGGDLVLPNEGQPADLKVAGGDGQTGTILEPARDSLVVRVTDRFGNPVEGAEVVWTAQGGGSASPDTVATGADGRAATQRVLGAQPGSYGTTAVAPALPEDVATFTTTAVAARIVLATQPAAVATSGAPFDPQPVVALEDPSGNALARSGVVVTVQISSGDGTLRGTTSRTTDADGRAAFTDLSITGAPGSRTLIFAASGYAPAISTPVTLGIGAAASVEIAAGDGQTARAGTTVSVAPAVLVRDQGGTPVPGVQVTFAVTSGGGSVTGSSTTTGTDGIATVGSWKLGPAPGANALSATVGADGVNGNPVTFGATATPGPVSAARSSLSASPRTITASTGSSASTITIVLRDALGNKLAGETVTLSATGAGVALTQPAITNASGTTTGTLSATGAGDHVVTAVSDGVTVGAVTVTVTPDVPLASSTTVQVPGGTAGAVTTIQATLKDQFGNPVTGAAAQVSVRVSGANSATVAVSEGDGGVYSGSYTPKKTGTDQVDVRVGGAAVPGSPFTSTVVAGPADPSTTTADIPDGQIFVPVTITVHVKDALGNSVGREGDTVHIIVALNELAVGYNGNGDYIGSFTPTVTGNNIPVQITLNGTAIAGSPFKLRVRGF